MNNKVKRFRGSMLILEAAVLLLVVTSIRPLADTGTCGGTLITLPFTDVPNTNIFFCAIASAYFSGLTNGTSPTTYGPSAGVLREQMAAFVTRTLDQSLRRGSRRAVLNQWWTPTIFPGYAKVPVGSAPRNLVYDGADLWVANNFDNTVTRVRASDGLVLQTWQNVVEPSCVLVAQGAVFVVGGTPEAGLGFLCFIAPDTAGPTPSATFVTNVGRFPQGITYDGARIWTANNGSEINGSVSIVSNGTVTTVGTGFVHPQGILYDGANIWVIDAGDNSLKKLNSDASIATSILVGNGPKTPVFDGANIWVPNNTSKSVTVVRVKDTLGAPLSSPFVIATLSGNGLNDPITAAFDGQRILVTNFNGHSVSLWKAADLTTLGSVSMGTNAYPSGACSDGASFWVTLEATNQLLRF